MSAVDPRAVEVVVHAIRKPFVSAALVASIQTTFQRSRLSHQGWRSRQLEGRCDGRTVWRNDARGSVDLFRERKNPAVTKLNVWLLVDASGSMKGGRACRAQDFAATMVEAFKRMPTVKLHVWQHSAFVTGRHTEAKLFRVAAPGVANKLDRMLINVGGGNADGFALKHLGQMALRAQRPDEHTVIIVVSDGAPTEEGTGATNHDLVAFSAAVSDELRIKGVSVLSVAIAGDSGLNAQMYGEANTMPFIRNSPTAWADLARRFATVFGQAVRG